MRDREVVVRNGTHGKAASRISAGDILVMNGRPSREPTMARPPVQRSLVPFRLLRRPVQDREHNVDARLPRRPLGSSLSTIEAASASGISAICGALSGIVRAAGLFRAIPASQAASDRPWRADERNLITVWVQSS